MALGGRKPFRACFSKKQISEKFYLVDSGSRNFFPDIISFVIITSQLNIDIESTVDYGNMGYEVSKGGQSAKI